ncbi:MAG: polysaccharide biosynthesis tyrosine autokinase [Desulfobacteraceae bacterium]
MGKFSEALEKSEKDKCHSELNEPIKADNTEAKNTSIFKKDIRSGVKSLSKIKKKSAPDLVTLNLPNSYEAEQFRTLKTSLLFSSDRKAPRTIMVTSAVPDEGKSFVAANLAVTYAQSLDEHVLLMDCDLRLPTVHKVFGLPENTNGLSDILSGTIDIASGIYKTEVDKLSIIPGGRVPSNPTELLSSIRMQNLLKEVESRYHDRYVIIDSPPPLLTAESIAISRQVDGILIVIKHESTRRKDVQEMIALLGKEKIIGIIVNRYDVRLAKYYGYGKYGSYYGKKSDQK